MPFASHSSGPSSSSSSNPAAPSPTLSDPASLPLADLRLDTHSKRKPISGTPPSHISRLRNLVEPDSAMSKHERDSEGDHQDNPPLSRRPPLASRQTSYSKRHSSFDTPREIPLPRMGPAESALKPTSETPCAGSSSDSVFSDDSAPELSRSSSMSSEQPPDFAQASRFDQLRDRDSGYASLDIASYLQTGPSPVVTNSRPFSTPDSAAMMQSMTPPQPTRPNWPPDRSSTSSLPLPLNVPYHTLPAVPPTTLEEDLAAVPSSKWNAEPGPSTHRPNPISRSSRTESGAGQGPATYRPPPMTRNSRTDDAPALFRTSSLPFDSFDNCDIPPPEPPTVLTPPPSESRHEAAPHEPFLSHGPPPENAWAAIETRANEYRLVVRLPGYNRQSITIATRKRRILHIVADKWEDGAGHFDQRVSYGYDADLGQVRAEFDGEHLLVRVPRRMPPIYVTNPKPRLR